MELYKNVTILTPQLVLDYTEQIKLLQGSIQRYFSYSGPLALLASSFRTAC